MLLYMDRQTLPNVATRITTEFKLKQEQYGDVEMYFGYAFAVGAFLWGCVADKWSVRWLYPALVLAWSAMGFLTGLVEGQRFRQQEKIPVLQGLLEQHFDFEKLGASLGIG